MHINNSTWTLILHLVSRYVNTLKNLTFIGCSILQVKNQNRLFLNQIQFLVTAHICYKVTKHFLTWYFSHATNKSGHLQENKLCEVKQICKWGTWYMKKSDFTDSIYSSKQLAGKFSSHKKTEMIKENLNWSIRGFPTILLEFSWIEKDFLALQIIKWVCHIRLWRDPPKNPFCSIISTLRSAPSWEFQAQITWPIALCRAWD